MNVTTNDLLYVSQAGRSIGPAALPSRTAATFARDTARASGKDALIYADPKGEPIARIDKAGNLSTIATYNEVQAMTGEAFRAAERDAGGRIYVPAGAASPDAVKALAIEVPAPTPAQANASAIGAWFMRHAT